MRKYLCALVIAVACAGLSQAASVATTGAGASKQAAKATPPRGLSDAQIERNIRARLAKSKMAATEHFHRRPAPTLLLFIARNGL